ncbi:MAG: bifunctional diguanylate cyclase/phosphodiesterase, partial [Leptolyngbyaceae bacterium]|nr:bifunctional diguanylate cyclase/phosphodiesterase [Leptolyngbyaceae bacterium]
MVGDHVLVAVARRLEACLRPVNTLARLGGDEFTVLLEDVRTIQDATKVAEKIHSELALAFQVDDHEVFLNASIGIVLANHTYDKPEHVLRDADTAMYSAKAMGTSRYQVFHDGMYTQALSALALETDLRRAIERKEFLAYYQPIVSLKTLKTIGFETLVRWKHPIRGVVYPQEFIAIAEETGLILAIDYWMLREACRQFCSWQAQNLVQSPLTMNVNLSTQHFLQPNQANLIQQIDRILEQTGMASHHLNLEITEGAIVGNDSSASTIFQELRDRQIQLSIDDFGTGYSSLSYLCRFPVNTLKLDRSFIHQMGEGGKNIDIVQTVGLLAHQLGITTVAEGIETQEQLDQLTNLGYEKAQGFFFAKPLDGDAATAWLRAAIESGLKD